jgi:small subunit ribosomal protein S8
MSHTVSNVLTSIRNASAISRPFVEIPTTRVGVAIVSAMCRAGYVWDLDHIEGKNGGVTRVTLKYSQSGDPAIHSVKMISKPGNRCYRRSSHLTHVVQGLGCQIVSTNRGVLTDQEARELNLGGEVVCELF